MNKPNIQTTKQVVPMLYGYSTPEVVRHNGWTKIGLILSILVDTFISKISFPMQPGPEIGSISDA